MEAPITKTKEKLLTTPTEKKIGRVARNSLKGILLAGMAKYDCPWKARNKLWNFIYREMLARFCLGRPIVIRGIGTLLVKLRKEKRVMNPVTARIMTCPSRYTLRFKMSKFIRGAFLSAAKELREKQAKASAAIPPKG